LEDDEICSRLEKIDRLEIFEVIFPYLCFFIFIYLFVFFGGTSLYFLRLLGVYSCSGERRGAAEKNSKGALSYCIIVYNLCGYFGKCSLAFLIHFLGTIKKVRTQKS